MAKKIQVEIWSDIVCPFCYLGKRRFEIALERFSHPDAVEVKWRSFQLNPLADSTHSKTVKQYLMEEKGYSEEEVMATNEYIEEEAADVGLDYHLDQAKMANTLKAHQFLHFAASEGFQNEAEEALFRAVFTEGKDINDEKVLSDIADSMDLNGEKFLANLAAESCIPAVEQDKYHAQQLGIRSVPYFVFNNRYTVSGAQDPGTFKEILEKVHNEFSAPETLSISGNSCDVDGNCD